MKPLNRLAASLLRAKRKRLARLRAELTAQADALHVLGTAQALAKEAEIREELKDSWGRT
jgi:hypothetical protein